MYDEELSRGGGVRTPCWVRTDEEEAKWNRK
jgi:hypothetical protein